MQLGDVVASTSDSGNAGDSALKPMTPRQIPRGSMFVMWVACVSPAHPGCVSGVASPPPPPEPPAPNGAYEGQSSVWYCHVSPIGFTPDEPPNTKVLARP